jgi:hypothetical protein
MKWARSQDRNITAEDQAVLSMDCNLLPMDIGVRGFSVVAAKGDYLTA